MRVAFIALSICTATALAAAQVPDSLRACAAESDAARRLACYDKEMAALAQPPHAHATVSSPTPAAENIVPADQFGLSQEQVRKLKAQEGTAEPNELAAHITKISQFASGRVRITLDNAQVWEQTEEDFGFNPVVGATATITRGKVGGFWMAADKYRKARVKRIR
jgi:hypothetical protein